MNWLASAYMVYMGWYKEILILYKNWFLLSFDEQVGLDHIEFEIDIT